MLRASRSKIKTMPPKVQRAKKVLKTLSQPSSTSTSIVNSQCILSESANFENMSAMELIKNIMELNRDPAIENMLIALAEKIPKEFTDFLESDKRDRSIVDWKNLRAGNTSSAAFLDFFQESGLEQHVLQPTHGSNTLDLVLSTSPSIQNVSLRPPLANSDHASVRFELLEGFSYAALLPTPDFLNVNYDRLNEYLSNVDWLGLFNNYVSMDDIYRRFCKTVYKALALFVPLKFPQLRPFKYPLHIRNLLAQKERLFRILDNPMSCPLYRK
ncbi:hypothetical protein COOONC_25013, partial [Cooperia oncophora]